MRWRAVSLPMLCLAFGKACFAALPDGCQALAEIFCQAAVVGGVGLEFGIWRCRWWNESLP